MKFKVTGRTTPVELEVRANTSSLAFEVSDDRLRVLRDVALGAHDATFLVKQESVDNPWTSPGRCGDRPGFGACGLRVFTIRKAARGYDHDLR